MESGLIRAEGQKIAQVSKQKFIGRVTLQPGTTSIAITLRCSGNKLIRVGGLTLPGVNPEGLQGKKCGRLPGKPKHTDRVISPTRITPPDNPDSFCRKFQVFHQLTLKPVFSPQLDVSASALILMISCVIALSKSLWNNKPQESGSAVKEGLGLGGSIA